MQDNDTHSDTETPASSNLWQSIQKNAINLGSIAVVLAATLALAYILASDRIAENLRQAKIQALAQVMPASYFDEDILSNVVSMPNAQQLNQQASDQIHVARKNGVVSGWIIPVTSSAGYSGNIRMLVGVDVDGNVTGVRITQHQETPGLGDKIDYKKSLWVDDFIDATLTNKRWAVKKDGGDFDQFTGATITPRAVVNAVADVLGYYKNQKAVLLQLAAG